MKSDELREIVEPVVESFGCELWGLEYQPGNKHSRLRVYLDRDGGVTIDDCSKVSQQLSAVLDVEDPIGGNYDLEVSSTGIERPLMDKEHYRQYAGHVVNVRMRRPVDGRRKVRGQIVDVEDDAVHVEESGQTYRLPFDAIGSGKLVVEF